MRFYDRLTRLTRAMLRRPVELALIGSVKVVTAAELIAKLPRWEHTNTTSPFAGKTPSRAVRPSLPT
jgi:hypothetical protein